MRTLTIRSAVCLALFSPLTIPAQQGALAELILPTGQPGFVNNAVYSRTGELALTASAGTSAAVLWQTKSGVRLKEFRCGASSAIELPVAISEDTKTALLGCPDRTVQLVDINSGALLKQTGPYRSSIHAVAYAPDPGQIIVVAAGVMLIDLNANRILKQLPGRFAPKVAILSRSGACAVAWNENIVQVADLRDWSYTRQIEGISYFNSGAVSDDCAVAALSADRDLTYTVDLITGKVKRAWKAHARGDLVLALSRDHKYVISGGVGDPSARVWDAESGEQVDAFTVDQEKDNPSVGAVAISPENRFVLAAPSHTFGATTFDRSKKVEPTHLESSSLVDLTFAVSPNGRLLATSGNSSSLGSVWLWDLRRGSPVILRAGKSHPTALSFSEDSLLLATGHRDGTLRIWRTNDWSVVAELKAHSHVLSAICFLPGSKQVLTGSYDGTVRQWDVATGKPVRLLKQAVTGELGGPLPGRWVDYIKSMSITPDGKRALAAGNGSQAALIDIASRKVSHPFAHKDAWAIDASAISFDGSRAVTAGNDGTVSLWNMEKMTFEKNLAGPFSKDSVSSVAFSPDGRRILTGSGLHARALEEWDVATGSLVRAFFTSPESIGLVGYSANGRFVISATTDGRIRLFDAGNASLLMTLLSFADDTWSVLSPEGLFDTNSLERGSPIRWLIPDDPLHPLGIEIFTGDYFTPKLIPKIIYAKSANEVPTITSVANLKRVQPEVEILDVIGENASAVTVRIKVKSRASPTPRGADPRPTESGVFDLRLFRDGQLVSEYPEVSSTDEGTTPSYSERAAWRERHRIVDAGEKIVTIPHVAIPRRKGLDRVVFTAYAFNRDRVKSETSEPVPFQIRPAEGVRRRAFLITMAVNPSQSGKFWDLTFAVTSAKLAAELWTKILTRDYDVVPITLESNWDESGTIVASPTATKANLHAVLDILAGRTPPLELSVRKTIDPTGRLDRATPDDAVVLYIASHGYADPQGRFYVIPFDSGPYLWVTEGDLTRCRQSPDANCRDAEDFLARSISSDDLTAWWRNVDGGEMVMILDSCHSAAIPGKGFRPGPLGDSGFGQISYDKRIRILAATQPSMVAKATALDRLGHTLLTEALRFAVQGQSGQNISDWLRAAEQQLPQRASQLYHDLKEDDLQLPELMDFVSRRIIAPAPGSR